MPIRVLVAALPELLHGIIDDVVAEHSALQVVARLPSDDDLADAARRYEADLVVISSGRMAPAVITGQLLYARRGLRVLALAANGRSAHLYRLLPHETIVDDVSPRELVSVMLNSDGADPNR
jgi:DNA-binding NarL/FixJ family response regulator